MKSSSSNSGFSAGESSLFSRLARDVRFWIVLAFLIRLIGITEAPLEMGHNWRQALTAMIARNFLQIEAQILYPRIDMAGEGSGIIGAEFPLFNYLIYLFAEAFGYSHWYGRLINLAVSSFGVYSFYALLRSHFSRQIAMRAALLLLCSIWFSFSRKIMPDTFSVALVIMGLHAAQLYLERGRFLHLILCCSALAGGMLSKIPAAALLAVFVLLPFARQWPADRRLWLLGAVGLAAASAVLWYFHWVPELIARHGYRLYFPKGLAEGWREILPLFDLYAKKFYFSGLNSYLAFGAAVAGAFWAIRKRHKAILAALLLVSLVFIAFTAKTGAVFATHNYYIIPFVPVLALLAALGLEWLSPKVAWALLGLIAIESTLNQWHDFFPREDQMHKLRLEGLMDEFVEPEALIVINGGPSPQEIYFANRRGWTLDVEDMDENRLDSLCTHGARYLIINRHRGEAAGGQHTLLSEDVDYRIYRMCDRSGIFGRLGFVLLE